MAAIPFEIGTSKTPEIHKFDFSDTFGFQMVESRALADHLNTLHCRTKQTFLSGFQTTNSNWDHLTT